MGRSDTCDIAIIGGGLAGGLIALALDVLRPEIRVRLIESGAALGGNHRWSWFGTDLSREGHALMDALPHVSWNDGYDVRFPAHRRHLRTPYRSLASADFDAALRQLLRGDAVMTGAQVASLDADGVTLTDGTRIAAGAVIDCRGAPDLSQLTGGWQVFLGRHLRTAKPHGVTRPLIMDATVAQHDAYRFVYVLPLSPDELFVEDTYYADDPSLDQAALSARIDAYVSSHGWAGAKTLAQETGVLPVITGGDFAAFAAANHMPSVARGGVRAGLAHPLTSYTLPFAVDTALAIARRDDLSGPAIAGFMESRAEEHWRATGFYRTLGAMLFGAAEPARRYRIFERFYRLPEGLIERFYAARSTIFDRARVLMGKPPVKLGRAISALRDRGAAL